MAKAKRVTLEQQLASRENGVLKSQITTGKLRGKGRKKKGGGKKKGKENVREDHWEEEFDVAAAPVAEPRVPRRGRRSTSYKEVESDQEDDASSSEEEEVTPRPSRGVKRKVVSTGSRSRPSRGRR